MASFRSKFWLNAAVIVTALHLAGCDHSPSDTASNRGKRTTEGSRTSLLLAPSVAAQQAGQTRQATFTQTETTTPNEFKSEPGLKFISTAVEVLSESEWDEYDGTFLVTLVPNQKDEAAHDRSCALAVTPSGTLLVWRDVLLGSEEERTTVTLQTKWFGTYQLADCGTLTLSNFSEVNPKSFALTTPDRESFASCDARNSSTQNGSHCTMYTGIYYKPVGTWASLKENCASEQGAFNDNGSCPVENRIGICIYDRGADSTRQTYFYKGKNSDPNTLKENCESEGAVWIPITP